MKVLVADTDAAMRSLLHGHLTGWGYDVLQTPSGAQAWHILQQDDAPALALLDWTLPELNGEQLCRLVRQRTAPPYVYILALTAPGADDDWLASIEAGADDYLVKPIHIKGFEVRLRAGRRIVDYQAQLIQAQEQLQRDANHDGLTGLLNRLAVMSILRHDCLRAARERTPLSVLMVDIDNFRAVNDRYGRACGDAVLCEVAARILRLSRPYDASARLGGEEFLVVLPGCVASGAYSAAERLRDALANNAVILPAGEKLMVTCSIGVAVLEDNVLEPSALVDMADAALQKAKHNGRGSLAIVAAPAGLKV